MSSWNDQNISDGASLAEPQATAISQPHWQGCKDGKLMVQCCTQCALYVFPPQPVCPQCLQASLEWQRSSGKGAVYSFSVVHRPQTPAFPAPYITAIIELEEGWHMLSNLIDCDTVLIGEQVEVHFQPRGDSVLPMFKKTEL